MIIKEKKTIDLVVWIFTDHDLLKQLENTIALNKLKFINYISYPSLNQY